MSVQPAGLLGSEKALLEAQVTIRAHMLVRYHIVSLVRRQSTLFTKSLCNGALHGCENHIGRSHAVLRHHGQAQELRMQKERVLEHEQRIKEQEAQIARLDRMLKDVINQQREVLFAPLFCDSGLQA